MKSANIVCRHCGWPRLRFIRQMTNVDKLRCEKCNKHSYSRIRVVNRGRVRVLPSVAIPQVPSYVTFNHQDKGSAYVCALEAHGEYQNVFEREAQRLKLTFVLTDSDIMGRQSKLNHYRKMGCPVFFVIPHTARPNTVNDIEAGWEHTSAQFVVTQGHADVMRAYGYDKPLHPVGWTMCPIKPFKARSAPRNVLFAPIHPRCGEIDQRVNKEAFKKLYKLAKAGDISLTVRFIRSLPESGLEMVDHPNVKYVTGFMRQEYNHIDLADVVVGHQTFAWLAVARGVPTVMMAEDMPTHIIPRNRPAQFAKNWEKYAHLLAYPFDIFNTWNVLGLLQRAVKSDIEIRDWYKRMIGYPFKPERFIDVIKTYL